MKYKLRWCFLLLIFLFFVSAVFADSKFKFDIEPCYTDYLDNLLVNYEAGGDLLKIKARVKTDSGSMYLQSLKAMMGFKNPWPAAGFNSAKIYGIKEEAFSGFSWNPSLLSNFKYYNDSAVEQEVQHNAGEIYFSVGVSSGQTRKQVSTTPLDLYQVDFHVNDGQDASSWAIKFDNIDGNGGENKAEAADSAVGGIALGNKLDSADLQTHFDLNILLAAPPQNFTGVKNVESTNKGNTLKITWDALSNKIGKNDWTPPILYDIYRNISQDNFSPDDNANRVFNNETGGLAFLQPAQNNVSILEGPNTGLPGNSPHVLDDNKEYYYIMRANDSTTDNPESIDVANKIQHKTTDTDNIIFGPVKPHDYTFPQWTQNMQKINWDPDDQTLVVSWSKPTIDSADLDGYVILKQGPFNSEQTLDYPNLGKATDDNHGPTYKVGDALGSWKVHKIIAEKSFSDGGLENGKYYYYAVYAYDQAGDVGGAFQQGKNYSPDPASGYGIPGIPPGAIKDFYAISSPEAGEISLHWDNPTEDWFGGVVFFATEDMENKWANIVDTSNQDYGTEWINVITDGLIAPVYYYYLTQDATGQPDKGLLGVPQSKVLTISDGLDPNKVYFFKAFSFNHTGYNLEVGEENNNVNAFKFSAGVQAAAIPALAAGAVQDTKILYVGTTPEVNVDLTKKPSGYGINTIVFPVFPMCDAEDKNTVVSTVKDLVDLINTKAGKTVVTTFGYWDKNDQMPIGFIYADNGNLKEKKGTEDEPKDVSLETYVGYQIYVSETVPTFKLVGVEGTQD